MKIKEQSALFFIYYFVFGLVLNLETLAMSVSGNESKREKKSLETKIRMLHDT